MSRYLISKEQSLTKFCNVKSYLQSKRDLRIINLLWLELVKKQQLWKNLNGKDCGSVIHVFFPEILAKFHAFFNRFDLKCICTACRFFISLFFCFFFKMGQLSSMVKTFVEGQESMLESLDEMIERHSQEQVSGSLQANLWFILNSKFWQDIYFVFHNNFSALFIITTSISYPCSSRSIQLKENVMTGSSKQWRCDW